MKVETIIIYFALFINIMCVLMWAELLPIPEEPVKFASETQKIAAMKSAWGIMVFVNLILWFCVLVCGQKAKKNASQSDSGVAPAIDK